MTHPQRQYFRLQYPSTERPTLVIQDIEFKVLDLSEYGVRFNTYGLITVEKDDLVDMEIRFVQGDSLDLSGHVIRVEESEVSIHLLGCIPSERIRADELSLRKKYAYAS